MLNMLWQGNDELQWVWIKIIFKLRFNNLEWVIAAKDWWFRYRFSFVARIFASKNLFFFLTKIRRNILYTYVETIKKTALIMQIKFNFFFLKQGKKSYGPFGCISFYFSVSV